MQVSVTTPVLVVLVAHDGLAWLHRSLDALDAQTHPDLRIVAVDNASQDGTREALIDRLGPDRVLLTERELGFPAAVSMALDATALNDAPYVLFLHEDCALAPDAVAHLAGALDADPRLAVVGPKLRVWGEPDVLQSAGWTIDLLGRADRGVDDGELDQGQRDRERRALYVTTAAMLVRRARFDALGRFDRRFHLFREDLDLCWRAWIAGDDVEVVPEAIAEHVAAATNAVRLGGARFTGPRYFEERNALAALLKNYGLLRLLLVLPAFLVVGAAKVVGFLLTRRVADAWQTVRAWAWNLVNLRETLRLRRSVQRMRTRRDRDLVPLFGRLVPRVRDYAEAIMGWVAGGDPTLTPPAMLRRQAPQEPEPAIRRTVRLLVQHPVTVIGVLLAVLLVLSGWPLLLPGSLRGGELAPWPGSPLAFLGDHAASWHAAGTFGTTTAPSPAQALLGVLHLLVGGSAYLAPRVLLLGTVMVAWLAALRAVQPLSRRKLPRVVAATAYVLSPPALAALAGGRIGALVVLAVLPGLVSSGGTLLRRDTPIDQAWRAVAAAVLLTAIGAAFEPVLLAAVLLAAIAALSIALLQATEPTFLAAMVTRLGTVVIAPVVVLLPWSLQLIADDGPLRGVAFEPVVEPLWRWLSLSPGLAGMPGTLAGAGFVLAGLLGFALAAPRAGRTVFGLWSAAAIGAGSAWALGRTGSLAWSGLPLMLTAGAFAGLLALAFAAGAGQLGRHAFGWRQVAAVATSLGIAVSIASSVTVLLRGPWDAYTVGEEALPAFVLANAERDDFRVLVLAARDEATVSWEVVPGAGPTMAAYGVPDDTSAALVGDEVDALLSGTDPGAASRLGPLGIRYVVVGQDDVSERLDAVLAQQLGLETRPVLTGRVATVTSWLPVASVVPVDADAWLQTTGELPREIETAPLARQGPGWFTGQADIDGVVHLAERADAGWQVRADGELIPMRRTATVQAGEVRAGQALEVEHVSDARSRALSAQVLVLLLTISLALRPPQFAAEPASSTPSGSRP